MLPLLGNIHVVTRLATRKKRNQSEGHARGSLPKTNNDPEVGNSCCVPSKPDNSRAFVRTNQESARSSKPSPVVTRKSESEVEMLRRQLRETAKRKKGAQRQIGLFQYHISEVKAMNATLAANVKRYDDDHTEFPDPESLRGCLLEKDVVISVLLEGLDKANAKYIKCVNDAFKVAAESCYIALD
ncbi:hypothetical protein TSUD_97960 [Trifolium subterraneum]|uniref:Uncharacterized protein n=1 Tax=Trifolium subterraneum TaxID=3900 RepID=A0A2Z6NWP5_TRISU|nr:hypothetical protein TSUD_97960 [Trifolium subterraneum]